MPLVSSPAGPGLRRQLSLYVPASASAVIEAVRQTVDPVQQALIPAHVTLGREEELADLAFSELAGRITGAKPLTLTFGQAENFLGHGILLGCTGGHEEFQALRERVLGSRSIRKPRPHLTLAHPRNPKAPGNSLAAAAALAGMAIKFDGLCLIEQESGKPWRVLRSFPLAG